MKTYSKMRGKMSIFKLLIALLVLAGLVYASQGVTMHNSVFSEEAQFHELQSEYFSISKSVRDRAETESTLTEDLVEIKNYPSELLRLKLVGVGRILTGIFLILVGILIALMAMPTRLEMIINQHKKDPKHLDKPHHT